MKNKRGLSSQQREVTETVFSTEVRSVVRHQHSAGISPPLVTSGEVVVFDDIGEDWRNNISTTGLSSTGTSPSPPVYHRTATDFFKVWSLEYHFKDFNECHLEVSVWLICLAFDGLISSEGIHVRGRGTFEAALLYSFGDRMMM